MPAAVTIQRWNGASPGTPTLISGLNTRANAEDTNTPSGTNNPVQIPSSGTSYSFWVCTRLQCTAGNPPANGIANLRWYSNGSNNFNAGIGCIGNGATAYSQATSGGPGTGTQLTTANYGASNALATPTDVFVGFPPGNPKVLGGALAGGATGDFGDWFVYQITVASNALPGSSGQTTFTFKYDET